MKDRAIIMKQWPWNAFKLLSDLFTNLIAENLVPINSCACHRQLATKSFEGGWRHWAVVFNDSALHKTDSIKFVPLQEIENFLQGIVI